MTDGGNNLNNDGMTPPPPPPPAPGAVPESGGPKPAWYENVAVVIVALFCCSPLGLILVWINKTWTTKTKTIITAVIIGLVVVGGIIGALSGGSSDSNASPPGTTGATQSTNGGSQNTTAPASAATCKETPNTESFNSKKQGLYPARAGATKNDHEAAVGDCVRISGTTTYVTGFEVIEDPSSLRSGKLIVVTISETNRDTSPKQYTSVDWKLQTPKGILQDSQISYGILDDQSTALDSAQLVTGATVDGTVAFEYDGPGTYYVVFDQVFSLGSDLGIWGITVP